MDFDFDRKLYISQVIPTVQGEGPLSGTPSLLIRLAGCNLRCKWCDTKYTWNGIGEHKGAEIVEDSSRLEDILAQYNDQYKLTNLMITGGEPLLYAKNPMFYQMFDLPFVTHEIETNGALLKNIDLDLLETNVYFNISPKLDYSFYVNKSEREELASTIKKFIHDIETSERDCDYDPCSYYTLKFVDVKLHRDLLIKFLEECGLNDLHYPNIRIMPWTPDRKDFENNNAFLDAYNKNSLETMEYCMQNGFCFNPRIHLYLFQDENETF